MQISEEDFLSKRGVQHGENVDENEENSLVFRSDDFYVERVPGPFDDFRKVRTQNRSMNA